MESIFIIVPPHSCSPAVLQQVRECLAQKGAQIDAEGFVARDALQLNSAQLASLWGSARFWSASASDEVLQHPLQPTHGSDSSFCSAEEDLKSLFYGHYGELWDVVVAEKRLQTAYDILRASRIPSADLEARCLDAAATATTHDGGPASSNILHLPARLTITRIVASTDTAADAGSERVRSLYVVNGTFPAEQDRFLQAGNEESAFWWCSASLSDATSSLTTPTQLSSAIRQLFPSDADVRLATNPLEALSFRAAWMHAPLDRDALATLVLQRGVPQAWLEVLLRDPVVHDRGHFTSVLGMVDGTTPEQAADTVASLWGSVQPSASAAEGCDAADGAPALYDYERGYVGPRCFVDGVAAADEKRTHAVVLVHPRVRAHPALSERLQQGLKAQDICVEAVCGVTRDELHAKLDLHFGALARYALDQDALRRLAVDDAEAAAHFEVACGVSWQQAIDEGRVWSISLAQDLLGRAQAQTVLQHCLSQAHLTAELSPALSITTVARQTFISLCYPDTSLSELCTPPENDRNVANGKKGADQPYSLTPDTFYVVNAAYGVYRHDVLKQSVDAEEVVAEVWQLSWSEESAGEMAGVQQLALAAQNLAAIDGAPQERCDDGDSGDVETHEGEQVAAAYEAAVGAVVRRHFPLLLAHKEPAAALRARHLWWGTPYDDDDIVARQLRARGQSWLSLLSPLDTAKANSAEAVLVLPPRVATNATISLTRATLQENGVTICEEADLYGAAAAAYVFDGGNSLVAAASAVAHRSGAALWAGLSPERQAMLREIADEVRAAANDFVPAPTADNTLGGATVCAVLQITLSTFAEAWAASLPRRVDATCWLAFLPQYEVWVVNGHVGLLEHRYGLATSRVHLLHLRWSAASASWAEMQAALIGTQISDNRGEVSLYGGLEGKVGHGESASSAGSLTLLLSRITEKKAFSANHDNTKDIGDAFPSIREEPLCLLSPTPYDAVIDLLRWPTCVLSNPVASEVALEDWLLQQPYVRAQLKGGSVACSLDAVVQTVRETLSMNADHAKSTHTLFPPFPSNPLWALRFTQAERDADMHHGFIWLHPSSVTPAVLEALPQLLLGHRVCVRASGVLPLPIATERELLDVHHDAFYKNAYVRTAAQVPITDAEAAAFAAHFHQDWIAAVQLGLVLNAQEAEQRYGAVQLTTWWDSLADEHQAQLSDQLFVGYIPKEGLYVMNPPYSYRRARLYAGGGHVAWYAVEWPAQEMTWSAFLTDVVGDTDPSSADPASLRGHFSANWTQYSLPGQPDAIECVLHASDSPLAALAERCRWMDCRPTHDPYGRVLLHAGVHPALLSLLLANPTLYTCATGTMTEAFHLLEQEDVHQLAAQLRGFACRGGILAIPASVPLIPPPAIPETPKHSSDSTTPSKTQTDPYPALVQQLRAHRDVALQQAVNLFQLGAFAHPFTRHKSWQRRMGKDDAAQHCAVLYLDPIDGAASDALPRYIEQHLLAHGIHAAYARHVRCASEAEAVVLHRCHHHRLHRYGVAVPAVETLMHNLYFQAQLKQHFDVSLQSPVVIVRNAAEMAEALHGSGQDVAALWLRTKRLYPRDTLVLADDCVVQRVHPRKPFFLINGGAMAAEQLFATQQANAGVWVWYLQWSSAEQPDMSYAQLAQLIAGLQGPRGPLRACCDAYGWAGAVHDATAVGDGAAAAATAVDLCPSLHVSESSLAAVRQRQLWLGLPICTDPVARQWCVSAPGTAADEGDSAPPSPFPPRALVQALQDPVVSHPSDKDETKYLWDAVIGMDSAHARERLYDWWAATRQVNAAVSSSSATTATPVRNSAVLAFMPQVAANAAVRSLVRGVIAESGLRIDEEGFVANHQSRKGGHANGHDSTAQLRRTLQYLYPEDWSYATQEPHRLHLTTAERDRVADVFQVSWAALLDSGRVLPASRATKRLGGMSPAQLQLFVKAAKRAVWVRPHLHVAELEAYGVYVVNAHVAHLANVIATTAERLPLPYYVVSWEAGRFTSWAECVTRVVGAAEPSQAAPESIAGRVSAAWAALGLHAAPAMGDCVVCMSDGPVHGLLARLHLRWPTVEALEEDELGEWLLSSVGPGVVPLLREWLANPQVTCDDRTDGVLTHLANWDTEEVVHLLTRLVRTAPTDSLWPLPADLAAVRQEERDAEGKRAAEAAWWAAVQRRDDLPVLLPRPEPAATNASTTSARQLCDTKRSNNGSAPASLQLQHRNVGTLILLRSQLSEGQQAQLRQHLQQRGVSVTVVAEEEEQEATPELMDRLFATESALAECHNLARVLQESNEIAPVDQQRFNTVFRDEVAWPTLLENTPSVSVTDDTEGSGCAAAMSPDAPRGLYSASDAMRKWRWTPQELWTHIRRGTSMQLTATIEVTRLQRLTTAEADGKAEAQPQSTQRTDSGGDEEEEAERGNAEVVPWAGHYVVNGAYAALRDALQPVPSFQLNGADEGKADNAAAASPTVILWEVSWDARVIAWRDFVQRIIGCPDSARAAHGSFNALLRAANSSAEGEGTASPLSSLGVVAATGPLAAFATRARWCRNARNRYNAYVPDPLVRAMAVVGEEASPSLLDSWLTNPLLTNAIDETFCPRLFDYTRCCDTPLFLSWLQSTSGASAAMAAASGDSAYFARSSSSSAVNDPSATDALTGDGGQQAPPLPPPRMKKQLNAARVRDALLHARAESDWRRLWDYYGTFDAADAAPAGTSASDAATIAVAAAPSSDAPPEHRPASNGAADAVPDTIPFAPFYRDFKSLDSLGVPNVSHELKLLFLDVEIKGRGRMTYSQFTHALSLYQAL